ncbi:hypothetical protein O1611_g3886 [Lasiodiplodia mahajangana]|uniref:Uncharacterized protein n=1 Tax=Lasiodiplodia mahajangana TaxID=1108764 RepID=A0ACC2JQE8_9PEZI|nr:hypothetical protein O1611_g3886 [Lasiodiplodia mahajangana]
METRQEASIVVTHDLFPLPPNVSPCEGKIHFCHPGYPPPYDLLFKLPRLDLHSPDSTSASSNLRPQRGVHYETALLACQIVANNAFNGFLATDRQGRERVVPGSDLPLDGVLTASQYWFFAEEPDDVLLHEEAVGTSLVMASNPSLNSPSTEGEPKAPLPYAVVPSFQDWAFPHDRMPKTWVSPSDTPSQPLSRPTSDRCCIVTQTSAITRRAPIVPHSDQKWFEDNAMWQYGDNQGVDQPPNKLYLRPDIQCAFDAHWFAIVPKRGRYIIHCFTATDADTKEFASMFHNRPVLCHTLSMRYVPPQYLFARFARAIFMLLRPFIAQSPVRRRVASIRREDDALPRQWIGWLSKEQLFDKYGGRGTKSPSPRPRKRQREQKQQQQQQQQQAFDDESSPSDSTGKESEDDSASDDNDDKANWYDDNIGPLLEGDRGRPRKRACHSLETVEGG